MSATTTATIDTADIDYQIGVMRAFKAGRKIESRLRNSTTSVWGDDDAPLWNWYACEYRVKPDPMDLLTELAERWSADSQQLHEKADTRKQQYGTNNSVFVSLNTQSDVLRACAVELLQAIERVKEASK